MGNDDELDPRRNQVRRGSEHVRIKGTTEELGEIVPPQVIIEEDREPDEDARRAAARDDEE